IGLRGGDIRGWLGEEPMRALEDARPELARQLRAEFGQLARLADEPGTGDWRHMLIPLNTGDAIEQIHMFMRQRKQEQEGGGNTETRFVIDVGLSRLGRIQLDGLIGEQNKRLDLIIRSQNPLPNQMQNDIRTIYVNTGGITGLTGGLSFQAAPPNFVEIDAPATPESSQSGIIA
ncbi:MAG: DNA polymerase III, partial [Rhodospirillales bacterium]